MHESVPDRPNPLVYRTRSKPYSPDYGEELRVALTKLGGTSPLGSAARIGVWVEYYAVCFARALGSVHRQVRSTHQLLRRPLITYDNANACRGVHPVTIINIEGDAQLCLEALSNSKRSAGIGYILQ